MTLLGDGAGVGDVAAAYDLRWLPDVDANVLRVPLFNALFDVTNRTTADVAVLLNADILFFMTSRSRCDGCRLPFPTRTGCCSAPAGMSMQPDLPPAIF